ncbi:GTPase IMAP family member 8-like protein [Labeo rohita]|uniref:GTPase IMAP family member 8-like protein n=1 Tax=Labeo rohita TaxID=84645 RepID=A0A498P4C0_LABRO|nr:GTPase IMAP family member 8-like protein [Labeo rohita]
MTHISENTFPSLSLVVFGNSSSVQFGYENIFLGEEQMNMESAEISSIVPVQREISECHVSVINMIDLHEAEHVDHLIGQIVNENEIHAFIFVLRLGQLTDADKMGLEWLQRVFGDKVLQFVMILFTYEREEECDTIIDDLKKDPILEQLLEKCGGRYHTCNKMMNNQSEMRDLMDKIEHLFNKNQQQCNTGEMYNTARMRNSECGSCYIPEMGQNAQLHLILLGGKQVGKSAAGNTLLGREVFVSNKSFKLVTRDVAVVSGTVDGFPVTVYDTPGFCAPDMREEKIQQMINEKVLQECKSGLCVFLLVIKKEDRKTVEKIEKLLGENHLEKTWILFTRGDELEDDNITIQEFINANEALKTLVEKYDQRYHVFNNKKEGSSGQAKWLLKKIFTRSFREKVTDRFTEHEQQIPQIIEVMFGQEVIKYSIILFTYGEQLEGRTMEKIIEENSKLRDLVQQCGGRYQVFSNKDENNRKQHSCANSQQFTAQVQGNLDILFDFMKRQEKTVNDLIQEIKVTSSHHKSQFADIVAKVEDNKSQVFTLLTTTKQKEESETDKLTKAMKQMITDELQKVESTLVSEMRFMVDQLQAEVQQDIKAVQDTFQTNHDHTTSELQQCVTQIDKFSTCVKELRNEMEKGFQGLKKQMEEQQKLPSPVLSTPITSTLPSEPSTSVTPFPSSVVKSDHIKLTFPTFGRPSDEADPLLYLTKCQDFLALHPLTDADILTTFRTVLHGTARDWWEVRHSSISTWSGFEAAFLSAFLSEDYEDELAEWVRTKIQGEKETIRDFAFSYRALCKRWKADLTEGEIVKMILTNIKPYLASQLRSRVNTVEELVKLGHQLEKDYEQQLRYEGRIGPKHPTTSQRPSSNRVGLYFLQWNAD